MDLPHYFPFDLNRRICGLGQDPYRKKFKVVFQDYGRTGHVDVKPTDTQDSPWSSQSQTSSSNVCTAQRQDHKLPDRSLFCAIIPTIPLSSTPAEVNYPLCDDVISDLPDLPAKVTRFSRSLTQVSSALRRGTNWSQPFLTGKRMLEKINSNGKRPNACVNSIEGNLPASVSNLVSLYTDLSAHTTFQAFNPRYSGGLLSCVEDMSRGSIKHLLFHATGPELDHLALTIAAPTESALVPSYVAAERPVEKIFQVNATAVGDHVFVATRHDTSCSVFSVPKTQCLDTSLAVEMEDTIGATCRTSDKQNGHISSKKLQLTPLGKCDFKEGRTSTRRTPTSVCLSPYLPGEGVFCAEYGMVKLWSAQQGDLGTMERQPRFECRDPWWHAYYANHPRQVVMADRTAVQMCDHRDGFRNSLDLFALPSSLVHKRERIMAARLHSNNSCPLHVVGTNHCLFVVDQRFGGTPVLHWYPDLPGPLQYLASTDPPASGIGERRGVLVAGCQHPAEVMCYPFNHGSGRPVTTSLNPWRVSKMSDMGDSQRYSCFQGATDPLLLEERVGMSLTGLAMGKGSMPDSFLVYQSDSYGELFFQQYTTPDNVRTAVKTGVPPPGKRDHHVPPEVQDHVNLWLERLQTQVVSLKQVLKKKKADVGRRVPSCREWLFTDTDHGTEAQTPEKCSVCKEDISTSDRRSISQLFGKRNILCGRCRHFCPHSASEGKRTLKTSSSRRSLHSQSNKGVCDGQYAASLVSEGMSLLNVALPDVNSYETDAFTRVHLELMKPKPHLTNLIPEREKVYTQLLDNMKSKYHQIRERKAQKRQAAEESAAAVDDVDNSRAFTEKHSVFNSVEHQQQNSLINEVISKFVKPRRPVTVAQDDDDENSASDRENTPPIVNDDMEDVGLDLFGDSEPEEMAQPLQNVSQDDDDEFFGSQDLFVPLFS